MRLWLHRAGSSMACMSGTHHDALQPAGSSDAACYTLHVLRCAAVRCRRRRMRSVRCRCSWRTRWTCAACKVGVAGRQAGSHERRPSQHMALLALLHDGCTAANRPLHGWHWCVTAPRLQSPVLLYFTLYWMWHCMQCPPPPCRALGLAAPTRWPPTRCRALWPCRLASWRSWRPSMRTTAWLMSSCRWVRACAAAWADIGRRLLVSSTSGCMHACGAVRSTAGTALPLDL